MIKAAGLAVGLCFCLIVGAVSASEQPQSGTIRTGLKSEISTVNVQFVASSDDLAAALNRMIGSEIYRGTTKAVGLKADIVRNGPIAVKAADNFIYLTMPVAISLGYGGFKAPRIAAKLNFRLNAGITPDWKLTTEIYYMGLSDLFSEEVGIGPMSIKPRKIIEGIIDPIQRVISDLISRKINEKYSLKAEVGKAWNAVQRPVRLDKDYNAWLKITPLEVTLYPLYTENNRVMLNLGLMSLAEVVVGREPAAPALLALPDLKPAVNGDKSFRIALNTDLPYRDILHIASPLLIDRELGSDGKSVILKDLDIYGKGDRLVVKAEARGSFEGTIYLTCKPKFDPVTNRFFVDDVDFDMQTTNILLKTADWFLHGKFRRQIAEKINMDLTEKLNKAREAAGKAIEQVKLAEHILLRGRVNAVKLRDVVVQKEKILVQLYAEGETTVSFQ